MKSINKTLYSTMHISLAHLNSQACLGDQGKCLWLQELLIAEWIQHYSNPKHLKSWVDPGEVIPTDVVKAKRYSPLQWDSKKYLSTVTVSIMQNGGHLSIIISVLKPVANQDSRNGITQMQKSDIPEYHTDCFMHQASRNYLVQLIRCSLARCNMMVQIWSGVSCL